MVEPAPSHRPPPIGERDPFPFARPSATRCAKSAWRSCVCSKPAPSPLTRLPHCSMHSIVRPSHQPNSESTRLRSAEARLVRIRVTDSTTGRAVVNLAFPLGLIKSGLDIAGQFVPEYLPKVDAIRESVTAGFRGPLVDVDDGGQRVEIIAE